MTEELEALLQRLQAVVANGTGPYWSVLEIDWRLRGDGREYLERLLQVIAELDAASALARLLDEAFPQPSHRMLMKRTWPIIGVRDVATSFEWYRSLLGLSQSSPAHDHFGQVVDTDGTVLVCLHAWGAHGHPPLERPENGRPGNGVLLFFRVDDFDRALSRARALGARLEEEPRVNENTGTREFSLRDPDGYFVTISAMATG